MSARLLVIGLDGATLDLVAPWAGAGDLPVLARLMAVGAWGRLRSTVPPATFPAWTSLVTGVNPGRHGVLDFVERVPGTLHVRFVNGSQRRTPALWTRLSAAGRRVAVLTVPATYPPEAVNGVMVSGFDSPVTSAIDGSFVFPRAFHADVERLVGRVPFADFQEVRTGRRWHERALASLLDGIERRTTLAQVVLRREPWDACMVVFGESDTVAHHFWRYHDPASPRYAPGPHAGAIARVYRALDAAIGRLVAAAGEAACVAVVSDHGSGGAGDRVVHLNRFLESRGFLGFRAGGGSGARAARRLAIRTIPFRLQGSLLRRLPGAAGRLEGRVRFGGIDWQRTAAFSEELDYHPSVWINLAGREAHGTVSATDYERTRESVLRALAGWRDEAGLPVVGRIWRREEVYRGPAMERAPDLLLELAAPGGYSPSCLRSGGPGPALRRLAVAEHGAGKGGGLNGAHRPEGLVVLAGPGVRRGAIEEAHIVDVLPTLLALGGMAVPEGLDGRPIVAALARQPRYEPDALAEADPAPVPYGEAESREIAARLASLGYLEAAR